MKRLVVIVGFIVALVGVVYGASLFLKNDNEVKIVSYDMDASDSKHYNLGDSVVVDDIEFDYFGYSLQYDQELKNYYLDLKIDQDNFVALESAYTFMLAKDDVLLRDTNCVYKNGKIVVCEIKKIEEEHPNQFVIINNKTFKILTTIEMDK